MKGVKVVVTIPAYNEDKTIGTVIKETRKVMDSAGHSYKVIVVDDNSDDSTARVAEEAGASVIRLPYNYRLSEVFRIECAEALKRKADIIVHIDADGQYLPGEIPRLMAPILRDEADLVLGSRFAGRIESMPLIKKWGNRAFSRVTSGITGVKITDSQTGFRAFKREVAERVKITSNYTYTQEMIIRAVRERFRVKEVPVFFAKRKFGKSKLISNPFSYAARAWINIVRVYRDYEALKMFGTIGILLMTLGLFAGLYVISLVFMNGWYIVDTKIPTIMLSVLLFVSGIQILLFGFLADKNQ